MRRRGAGTVIAVIAGWTLGALGAGTTRAGAPDPSQQQPPPRRASQRLAPGRVPGLDWTALESALASFVPGTVSGLTFQLARRGETLYLGSFGDLSTDAVLPIASATKMPSALAIMTLVDDGLLDLDRPVEEYVAGRLRWPADKAGVTMRMLLNHTSGLVQSDCLGDRRSLTLQECAQEIVDLPAAFAPGTMFAYGGAGFQVAGYVAELLSGESWNELFADRIGGPLELRRFGYGDTANPRIAGGASSDVADYTRVMQLFLAGGVWQGRRVLSESAVATMTRDQKGGLPVVNSPGGDALPGYSFGWWISDPLLHPGSDGPELSDQGAFGCTPWIDLDLEYSAIILIRSRTTTGTAIWNAVRPTITDALGHGAQ